MSFVRLSALALSLAASAVCAAQTLPAAAVAARPPVAAFFDNTPFSAPLLSPDGKMLAVVVGVPGKREGLAVIDLADNKIYPTASFADVDIGKVQWVNDKRLIFDTTNKQLATGDREYGPGLYAANFDGSGFRQLAERRNNHRGAKPGSSNNKLLPYNTLLMNQPGAQNSDSVYVQSPDFSKGNSFDNLNLLLLDTTTGRARTVERPQHTQGWLLDAKGEPRMLGTVEENTATLHYRDPTTQAWRSVVSFNLYPASKGVFSPLAFGADGTLYVSARAGQDKSAVHTFDLATGKLSEKALITLADYDFSGRLIFSNGKLLGFRTRTDAEATMWLDPGMKALQDKVDALLGNTVNLISVPARPQSPWVLVESYSDVQPKTIRMYNTASGAFNLVGSTRPDINPAQMGQQQFVRYKARDGRDIPALLTLPAGASASAAKPPMVVMVHGGPYVRGSAWGWSANAQFLASRGYAVLEPEYRGSAGFGDSHFRAGFKQWGLAMQDDVADGTQWAIDKGYADPQRICIAGASYGGYATLMGLVKHPELYKCGIDWVGVTDIKLLFDGHWSFEDDLPELWHKYGMPELIGDPVKDAAQFTATSPLAQAARIKQPLLLAYGSADRRVPLMHGKKFYEAVKQTNNDVEWVLYEGEGHGWATVANRIDFWSRVEKFLDRQIGTQK
ncbi:S9 family peptidase [Massilia sp. CF038]|uniref:alpha/beta hydrolase family protein n=1 Tax=Massilia sp. CF038 TaxID=1881045 RepID=UPI0009162BC3|nr:alpha/beta fold hydrolase [Massilia sp. CF038]SHH52967.1 Dipeptidyl aminopeptidase/acylaminoacyl peptidase [Massilia sp. CF038]